MRSYSYLPRFELAGTVLILVRVHGVPVAYGVYNSQDESNLTSRQRGNGKVATLQLQSMTAIRPQDIHSKVVLADDRVDDQSFSIEFYGCKKLPRGAEGTDQQLWCGNFAVRTCSGYRESTPYEDGQQELLCLSGKLQRADPREYNGGWSCLGMFSFEGPEHSGWRFIWGSPTDDLGAFWTQYEWE